MSDLSIGRFVTHQGHSKLRDLVDQELPEATGHRVFSFLFFFSFLLEHVCVPECRDPSRPEVLELLVWMLGM